MNIELIVKLVEKADEDFDLALVPSGTIEKFVEVLVEECVRYVNEEYQRDFESKWREDLSEGIKKHFGIK